MNLSEFLDYCVANSKEQIIYIRNVEFISIMINFIMNAKQLISLPGRALASGQHIWLCDAQYADMKVFCRSLLAKVRSVSI